MTFGLSCASGVVELNDAFPKLENKAAVPYFALLDIIFEFDIVKLHDFLERATMMVLQQVFDSITSSSDIIKGLTGLAVCIPGRFAHF
jgi:hypothetical protein